MIDPEFGLGRQVPRSVRRSELTPSLCVEKAPQVASQGRTQRRGGPE